METLWAALKQTPRGFLYELLNSPWYAKGVSHLDQVRATPSEAGLKFHSVIVRGGHSTYWLRFPPDSPNFETYWAPLQALGCTYEGGRTTNFVSGSLVRYSVDVPPEADIYQVYALIEKGETEGVWEFAEGHCGHPLDGS